jgi:predicted CoA-binding protein
VPPTPTPTPPPTYSDAFLTKVLTEAATIALVGASPKPDRPSHKVMRFLQEAGYRVIPVNPGLAGQAILGETVHAALADIPGAVDMVDIFRNSEAAGEVVDAALAVRAAKSLRSIWMQLDVRNDAAAARAEAAGLDVVMDRCPKIEHARLGLPPRQGGPG